MIKILQSGWRGLVVTTLHAKQQVAGLGFILRIILHKLEKNPGNDTHLTPEARVNRCPKQRIQWPHNTVTGHGKNI